MAFWIYVIWLSYLAFQAGRPQAPPRSKKVMTKKELQTIVKRKNCNSGKVRMSSGNPAKAEDGLVRGSKAHKMLRQAILKEATLQPTFRGPTSRCRKHCNL